MKTGVAIVLAGLGAALLAGVFTSILQEWALRNRNEPRPILSGLGAFLLTAGAATLYVRAHRLPLWPPANPPAEPPVDTRIARRYEEELP